MTPPLIAFIDGNIINIHDISNAYPLHGGAGDGITGTRVHFISGAPSIDLDMFPETVMDALVSSISLGLP